MSNPFKIIQPTEAPPSNMKGEVMGSVDGIVMVLRFVQLFAADSTAVMLTKMKVDLSQDEGNQENPET